LAIEISNLQRTYFGRRGARDVTALEDVNFSIESGEFFGILGPNGAGKTTLVRVLSTLLTPTAGSAVVDGLDVVSHAKEVRRRVGVSFGGDRGLYDRLTARDNLQFAAELYEIHPRLQRTRIQELLQRVGLADRADDRVESFSRGMKQRLHIARSLIHEPSVLLLDEPTSGLDPVSARSVRELVREVNSSGTTVVLTTHYMFEADELCERVGVVVAGRVRRLGTPHQLKSSVQSGRTIEIDIRGDSAEIENWLTTRSDIISTDVRQYDAVNRLKIFVNVDSVLTSAEVSHRFANSGVTRAVDLEPSLEDAYVAIVEQAP